MITLGYVVAVGLPLAVLVWALAWPAPRAEAEPTRSAPNRDRTRVRRVTTRQQRNVRRRPSVEVDACSFGQENQRAGHA
ncbi:hypothetical protein HGA13_10670 [Nocardia speluncae]|uniref:Uncharacterized protein n=1 Tax=Nocardia speluncae TaxID=419477 RepID=A0A846XFZ9_9NOCA|nr:hypothetical protein [Nocardia speluncae]NKY33533.1 hypothetical protein [Nocardia speluncae]